MLTDASRNSNVYCRESALIVIAWLGGIVSGLVLGIGAIGLVTGRMPFNPARIDWFIAEGRALGAIALVVGLFTALLTLAWVSQIATTAAPLRWFLPIVAIVPFGGSLAVMAVGRRHDACNPIKRYWRWPRSR